MSLVAHAEREFEAMGWPGDDEAQVLMCQQVVELLDLFDGHGHSGSSAPYAIRLFGQLARFEPLCPLTGEDCEWVAHPNGVFKNKRCAHVFRDADGAYDLDGKVFREPNGSCFTNHESRVPVTFPYTPKTEYVDVEERAEEEASDE